MSRSLSLMLAPLSGFPRVSGDEPFRATWDHTNLQFSPRERG